MMLAVAGGWVRPRQFKAAILRNSTDRKARPGPATELRLALAVRHVRVLASVLFIGRVYQHDAHMYEKADEDCTDNVMHTTSTQQNARSAFVCFRHDMHLLMQTIIKRAWSW
jgi:hypothetical protein